MLKEKYTVISKAMLLFDGFIVSVAFFLTYFLRMHFHKFYKLDLFPSNQIISSSPGVLSEYLVILFLSVLLWCFMLYLNGMYRSMRTRTFFEILWIIIKSSLFANIALGAIIFLFKLQFVSRIFFIIFVIASLAFLLSEKIAVFSVMHYVRKRGYNYRRLLIVGTGKRAASFVKKIQYHPEWGFQILGAIDDEPYRAVEKVGNVGVIGILKNLPQIIHTYAIDEVVFVVPRSRLNYMENAINACETEGVKATIAVDLFDLKIARLRLKELEGTPLVTFETTVAEEWQLFIKRTLDFVISGICTILLSPFLLITAILIRLTSSGPVLFRQNRIGLNGRKFVLYKFRTMYRGAEKELSNFDVNEMARPDFKKKKIKYITPVGRILRKFSIDELPQLFNVFVGHMSLIGPRPTVPKEVVQYKSWQRRRLSMRPGITCLWQVNGRNKIDFEEWMKWDLEYLDNWSLWLDFKILIKTVPVVLFGIGAY